MRAFVILCALCLQWCECLSASKLSIHTSMGKHSWTIVQQGQPRVIKLLDAFDDAPKIKRASPGTIIVGRIFQSNQPQDGDPTQRAGEWWNATKSNILSHPAIDYWEGYNEPDGDKIAWVAEFEAARVQILAQHGLKASVGNWGTGSPDVNNPSTVRAFYPAIDAAVANKGILGLHEYSAPYMNGTYSGGTCDGEGWLTGRYRKLVRDYLKPDNKMISIVISENGIDGGTCVVTKECPHTGGGYKDFCDVLGPNCADAYMKQLIWYDQVMRCDDYIIGSTIFSLEIDGWESFDIGDLTNEFASYLASQH